MDVEMGIGSRAPRQGDTHAPSEDKIGTLYLHQVRLTDSLEREPVDGGLLRREDSGNYSKVFCSVCGDAIECVALLDYIRRYFTDRYARADPFKPRFYRRWQGSIEKHRFRLARRWISGKPDMRPRGRRRFAALAEPIPVNGGERVVANVASKHDLFEEPTSDGYLLPAKQEHRLGICSGADHGFHDE